MNAIPFKAETIAYRGWKNCVQLTSEQYQIIVTSDVGPRIISFKRASGNSENILKEYSEMSGEVGAPAWRIYGGHRLWCAPEDKNKTYYPDNTKVAVAAGSAAVTFTSDIETTTRIQKEIEISFLESGIVRVLHRVWNRGTATLNLAPWSLTVMRAGGVAVLPLPAHGAHSDDNLLPTARMSLWAYTDLADGRYRWGKDALYVRQDVNNSAPQKIGFYHNVNKPVSLAYVTSETSFLKSCPVLLGSGYPDLGVVTEMWMNHEMLELETLAPLTDLAPGKNVEHEERWILGPGIVGEVDDVSVRRHLATTRETLVGSWR